MIYKRLAARQKRQDWVAVTIELALVVVGVFLGLQVSTWNDQRRERGQPEVEKLAGHKGPGGKASGVTEFSVPPPREAAMVSCYRARVSPAVRHRASRTRCPVDRCL